MGKREWGKAESLSALFKEPWAPVLSWHATNGSVLKCYLLSTRCMLFLNLILFTLRYFDASFLKKKLQYFAFHEKENPLTLPFRNVQDHHQMGFDKSLTLYKINGKIKFQQAKNYPQ